MSSNLRLSIIVPVYNVEKWLVRCLDSLYNQGLSENEFEVIIVNDGSPDRSPHIAQYYATHHKNMVVITRENGGLSAARNTGLDHANGKYVWFVDSDDFIEPNSINLLLEYAEKHCLDVMCFNLQRFFEDGRKWIYTNPPSAPETIMDGKTFVCTQHMPPAAWLALYKRDFLYQNNLKFKENILHEDMEFTPRAYYLARTIAYRDIVIVNYFQREGSIMKSAQNQRRVYSLLQVCDSLHEFMMAKVTPDSREYNYFLRQIAFVYSQALSHWTKDSGIRLEFFRNKAYYPLSIPCNTSLKERFKIRMTNFSLPLYCMLLNLTK